MTATAQPASRPEGPLARGRAWSRARWGAWWQARHPRSDTLRLTQHTIYIVPTGAGWLFAVLLAVLLLASINFQLSLGYLLTFVLAGAAVTSIHTTHAVLRDLEGALQVGATQPAGQAAPITLRLCDGAPPAEARAGGRGSLRGLRRLWRGPGRARHGIRLQWLGTAADATVWTDVPAGGESRVQMHFLPARRGWHVLPDIRLETRFPFGMFRAWSFWRPASPALAWPVAEVAAPALPSHAGSADAPRRGAPAAPPAGDSSGVRPWRRGDTPQQILWKKSAQVMAGGGDPVSREQLGSAAPDLRIDWQDAGVADTEQRIARLTAWVRAADARGARYALSLPGQPAASQQLDVGPHHLAQCLDRLACWGQARPDDPRAASARAP